MNNVPEKMLQKDKCKSIKETLEKEGLRFTYQRGAVLRELLNDNKHLTVEDLFNKLRDKNVGLATIYRTIKLFLDIGIVKEIIVDGINYYELAVFNKKPAQIHFKCIKCNSIIDINNIDIHLRYLNINKDIEEEENYLLTETNVMLTGICDKCRGET